MRTAWRWANRWTAAGCRTASFTRTSPGEVASDVETVHLFEGGSASPGDVLLNEAVRHPAAVHRFAHRQAVRTFGFL